VSKVLSALQGEAFKALTLQAEIEERKARGELLPGGDPAMAPSLLGKYEEFFSVEIRARCERMTYVYALFYCFENVVRDLVAQRLEERKGQEWWNAAPDNVRKRVEQKKTEAAENKWHQATIDSNIDYTLFGDLASMVVKEWQEFEDLFPTQGWVKQRLDELERSRNIIAHGNLLSESEVQRIEQYLDDWLRQVP
jgi:hypothetical protein